MKMEVIHGERFATREQLRCTVFDYIEVDDNRNRRHSANGCVSPEAFEAQQALNRVSALGGQDQLVVGGNSER